MTEVFKKPYAGLLPLVIVAILLAVNTGWSAAEDRQRFAPIMNAAIKAPLIVGTANPRYFMDGEGKAIYLTGSHTWSNFIDFGDKNPPPKFDYLGYLGFLQKYNHNFFRLWNWEQTKWVNWIKKDVFFNPSPYMRPGPGTALDGKSKFDLTQFNEDYFSRMRKRVKQAGERGIYVSVMLFDGFSVECKDPASEAGSSGKMKKAHGLAGSGGNSCAKGGDPWLGHPFNRDNNVNGIDGDPDGDGEGKEIQTLKISEVTRLQERYVRKVIDTLNDLPNVLWEICNESHSESIEWQYHMIRIIKEYESQKPYQHPVGMTAVWPGGRNSDLFESPADWVSPNDQGADQYKKSPPPASGKKVILTDTDHLWGVGGDYKWVWKSFLRGLNPIFMDPYSTGDYANNPGKTEWELIRKAMGYTRVFAEKANLIDMSPRPALASSGYCLAGRSEYLVYQPNRDRLTVKLNSGQYLVEWLDPRDGRRSSEVMTAAGGKQVFLPPSNLKNDSVLYLLRR